MIVRSAAFLLVVLLASGLGYFLGFRTGADYGLMIDAPVRGSTSLSEIRWLRSGKLEAVNTSLEADVDNGLMWWSRIEQSPLHGALNFLQDDIVTDRVRYVKRLAQYRKVTPSPILAPAVVSKMLKEVRASDPAFAHELESGPDPAVAIASMVAKYGQ